MGFRLDESLLADSFGHMLASVVERAHDSRIFSPIKQIINRQFWKFNLEQDPLDFKLCPFCHGSIFKFFFFFFFVRQSVHF